MTPPIGRDGFINPSSFTWSGYDTGTDQAFWRALSEAWGWLVAKGMLALDPSQSGSQNFFFVTRLGRQLLDEPRSMEKLRAEERLGIDLHPRLSAKARAQFLIGDAEMATLTAMRAVEIYVRELCDFEDSLVGVQLMQEAFKAGGPLFDPSLDKGESEQTMALFRGAMGVFRNPPAHRQVDYEDSIQAAEVILFADLLLRLLDQRAAKLQISKK